MPVSYLPPQLLADLTHSLQAVYGQDSPAVLQEVLHCIEVARLQRPAALQALDAIRPDQWYKDEIIYMFYVDRLGAPKTPLFGLPPLATFDDTAAVLPYLNDLGVTTLYLLPFMASPMGDAGFDVRDFKAVRAELGGLEAFKRFALKAKQQGFKLKSDLILNHVSDQHPWFKAALAGDADKLNYFAHTFSPPTFRRYRDEQRGMVIDYTEADGSISSRRLIFPDNTDTHYRKEVINGQDVYFYHTFYPFQLDLNWQNPALLLEVMGILSFWANLGIDIFRMDAIPYFFKTLGTDGENQPNTHHIIKLLSLYLQATAPASVLQAEACQWPKAILPYYGEERTFDAPPSLPSPPTSDTAPFTRTNEVQIAYHFPLMPALWASLLMEQAAPFWHALQSTPTLPPSAAWAIFLRVHDELTLEMVDIETRNTLYHALAPLGQPFRKGLGVSGRLANFLQHNPQRIALAFRLLLSLPGIPILYYGDELGAANDTRFAKTYAKQRQIHQQKLNPTLEVSSFYDSRDTNRGPLTLQRLQRAINHRGGRDTTVLNKVKPLVQLRRHLPVLSRGTLEALPVLDKATQQPPVGVLAYSRRYELPQPWPHQHVPRVDVLHNLTPTPLSVTLDWPALVDNEAFDHYNQRRCPISRCEQGRVAVALPAYGSVMLSPLEL
jgi:maltose alpha-D-glucosyltransferase/alpha-amylase